MLREHQSSIGKMWCILIALLLTQVGATAKGCSRYCDNNLKCIHTCEAAIQRNQSHIYADYKIGTKFVGAIDTAMEITGSDSVGRRGSRSSYFTTRDGKIYYLGVQVQNEALVEVSTELKLAWEMPESMGLDTANNKGLYSIAFSKSNTGLIPAYVVYAKKRAAGEQYDHHLCIATLALNTMTQTFKFVKTLFTLPQTSNFRSGGFLATGKADYSVGKVPLWFSSGGNEYNDADLMQRMPRYSAISAVWTDEVLQHQDLTEYFVPNNLANYLWANGIHNPIQCDYSILRSREMPCLVEIKDISGETEAFLVTIYEKGHTPNENTASVYRSSGMTSVLRHELEQYFYSVDSTCPPETIYYNTAMGIGSEYMNRILIAQPSCKQMGFPSAEVSVLERDYSTGDKDFTKINIALAEPYLYDVELIGSELNRGIYLAGRSLRSGDYELYMLYDRTIELERKKKKK